MPRLHATIGRSVFSFRLTCSPDYLPLLVLILPIGNNKKIMGKYTNSRLSNVVGLFITVIVAVAAIALLLAP